MDMSPIIVGYENSKRYRKFVGLNFNLILANYK